MTRANHASRQMRGRLMLHLGLVLAAVIVLLPFIWIAAAAFKTQISLLLGQVLFQPVLLNFNEVLFGRTSSYSRNFLNSLLIASVSTTLVMVVGFLAGYSLFRMRWPRWVITLFLLWAMVFNLVPPVTLAGAWYELFRGLGLRNGTLALVLAHTTLHLPMALWLLSSFLKDIPREIEEAAEVDGADFITLILKVVLPVMLPGIVSTGILVFIFSWNEFPVALALTNSQTATVPVGIAKYAQENEIKFTQMAAASVLSAIPALLALIFGQRFIVNGLTAGAVK
ncbi:MAG: carbohydrate ABC transporter permease [Devosia sp.]